MSWDSASWRASKPGFFGAPKESRKKDLGQGTGRSRVSRREQLQGSPMALMMGVVGSFEQLPFNLLRIRSRLLIH
jgi:hypothetical protein